MDMGLAVHIKAVNEQSSRQLCLWRPKPDVSSEVELVLVLFVGTKNWYVSQESVFVVTEDSILNGALGRFLT